jgi:thiamine biosynthesis protein ThiS
VDGLVELLGLADRRVAVAINHDVVPRSAFGSRRLAPGDHVEILEAVGGG